jgi:hypothetical protein
LGEPSDLPGDATEVGIDDCHGESASVRHQRGAAAQIAEYLRDWMII